MHAALEEEDEPVVLVGHSYGGMVINDAASGNENVRHLGYVTSVMPAVMPERDETLASIAPKLLVRGDDHDGCDGEVRSLSKGVFARRPQARPNPPS